MLSALEHTAVETFAPVFTSWHAIQENVVPSSPTTAKISSASGRRSEYDGSRPPCQLRRTG